HGASRQTTQDVETRSDVPSPATTAPRRDPGAPRRPVRVGGPGPERRADPPGALGGTGPAARQPRPRPGRVRPHRRGELGTRGAPPAGAVRDPADLAGRLDLDRAADPSRV